VIALGLLFYRPISALELSLIFGMWLLTGLGMTVGHRLFTHGAFSTSTHTQWCASVRHPRRQQPESRCDGAVGMG